MRALLIAATTVLVFCATDIFAMGKKDSSKQEAEKALKATKPAEKTPQPAAKPQTEIKPKPTAPAKQPAVEPAQDKVVVTVNGTAIKNSAVEARLDDAIRMQMGAMGPAGASLPPERLQSLRDRMRQEIVDGLVLEQIVDQKLKADKIEITDQDIDAKLKEITAQHNITLEQIKEQLGKNGVTMEAYRGQLKRHIGVEKIIDAEMTAAGEATTASDEEAREYYDANAGQYGEEVRASHILIKADEKMDQAARDEAKKKIEDLLAKARAGADFAELAREHSEDPGSKSKGGEYTFPRGRMVKPFEDAAFGLEVGQISDVVETQYGYHIIKLSEKIPAKTLEQVKEQIVQELTGQKKGRFWMTLREKLKNEAKVEWSAEEKARMDAAASRPVIRPQVQPQPQPQPQPK